MYNFCLSPPSYGQLNITASECAINRPISSVSGCDHRSLCQESVFVDNGVVTKDEGKGKRDVCSIPDVLGCIHSGSVDDNACCVPDMLGCTRSRSVAGNVSRLPDNDILGCALGVSFVDDNVSHIPHIPDNNTFGCTRSGYAVDDNACCVTGNDMLGGALGGIVDDSVCLVPDVVGCALDGSVVDDMCDCGDGKNNVRKDNASNDCKKKRG